MDRQYSEDVYFCMSDQQVNEENQILAKSVREYICGLVYVGNKAEKYSKMIKESELKAMESQYPDTRIVASGSKNDFKFTRPQRRQITGN